VDLSILDILYKWNLTVCGHLTGLLSLHIIFQGSSSLKLVAGLHSFLLPNNIHCMHISYFVYPPIHWCTFEFFPPFGYCEWCCLWTFTCKFLFEHLFFFFWSIPKNGIVRLYSNSMFNLLRNRQNVLCNGYTVLHFQQQRTGAAFSASSPILVSFLLFCLLPSWCVWGDLIVFSFPSPYWLRRLSIFMCLLVICISSLEKCLFKPFAHL